MTLSELLEELKDIDRETYDGYIQWQVHENIFDDAALEFILQGEIQKACEKRGWEIEQNYRTRGRDGNLPKNMRHYAVVTSWDNDVHTYRGIGSTGASALLAAYVAAVKEGRR